MSERSALILLDLVQHNPSFDQIAIKIDEQLLEIEQERDRLKAELDETKMKLQIKHEFMTVALDQRDKAYKEIAEYKSLREQHLITERAAEEKLQAWKEDSERLVKAIHFYRDPKTADGIFKTFELEEAIYKHEVLKVKG